MQGSSIASSESQPEAPRPGFPVGCRGRTGRSPNFHLRGSHPANIALIILALAAPVWPAAQAHPANDRYAAVTERLSRLRDARFAAVSEIGASVGGRPIYAVTLTSPDEPQSELEKRTRILVLCGQHGNEPTPVRSMLDLIDTLARARSSSNQHLLRSVAVVIVPVVNPDGFSAFKRRTESGVDLNRSWNAALRNPEAAAVYRLIRRFRPHVLIDEHEWTEEDPCTPNRIEAAGFGDAACCRLARRLALAAARRLSGHGLALRPTYYGPASDLRLAHRRFVKDGVGAVLVETSREWPAATRVRAYQNVVTAILSEVARPADGATLSELRTVRRGMPDASPWLASLQQCPPAAAPSPTQTACWVAFLAAAAFIVLRSSANTRHYRNAAAARTSRSLEARGLCLTEIVRSDLPVHAKLALIQRSRPRPSDRS